MGFFRRILEGLFINLLWWLFQVGIIALPIILYVYVPDIFVNKLLFFFIFIASCILVFIIWYFGWRYYPLFTWDIIHIKNTYILTYTDRKNANYERIIKALPLSNGIKAIKNGEYRWSGNASTPFIKESGDYTIEHMQVYDRVEYIVHPKGIIRAYRPIEYTLGVTLTDTAEIAIPTNFVYIKRPTKRITLVLKMANNIPIKNVRYVARTKYGEENKLIFKEGKSKQEDGYNIYEFVIRRPKLFCEYEICWQWCE